MHCDGDLNNSLVEGPTVVTDLSPDIFQDIMCLEVATLVDQLQSVLEEGLHMHKGVYGETTRAPDSDYSYLNGTVENSPNLA